MKISSVLTVLLLASAVSQGVTIVSSFGTTTGADDDNQAGPIRGVTYLITTTTAYTNPTVTQGYTATHTLSATDPAATQVEFQSLTWQRSGSTAMSGTFYVAIVSGFAVDGNGNVTSVGTLQGISTNSITNPAANSAMTWNFNNPLLNVGSSYQFVLTNTANPLVAADFVSGQFELKTGSNLLAETTMVGGNASSVNNAASWEPVFSMTYNTVPEPSAALLGGLGLLGLLRRRRA